MLRAIRRYRHEPYTLPVADLDLQYLMKDPRHELFSTPTEEWATDGSAKHGATGYGMNTMVQGGVERYHKMPGKQTINRGEALAVLHCLLETKLENAVTIYCDSQTTISSSEKLMQVHTSKRAHKDIAN